MSETTPEATVAPTSAPTEAPTGTQEQPSSIPPWGEDFNPEIAWERLQKVQRENKDLRQRPAMTPEQQKQLEEYDRFVQASKSESQRQAEALEAANRARDVAAAEALRYRVAAEHGIGKDDLGLLGTGTEEQMTANAQRIVELSTPPTSPAPATPAPGGQRPVEQLRPGATPTAAVSEDDANYARLFGPDAR